jgi:hypothetical protein
VGVFEATASNPYPEPLTVSLLFTWENLGGWQGGGWQSTGQINRPVRDAVDSDTLVGVVLDGGPQPEVRTHGLP